MSTRSVKDEHGARQHIQARVEAHERERTSDNDRTVLKFKEIDAQKKFFLNGLFDSIFFCFVLLSFFFSVCLC